MKRDVVWLLVLPSRQHKQPYKVSFGVVWLLVLPAHEQAAQAATQVSFGSSRRRPMRAPVGGSVCARV